MTPDDHLGCRRVVMGDAPGSVIAWTWGTGRTPVVFLHALLPAASGRSVAETALRLTERLDVRVVGLDAPGFGESDPLPPEAYDLDALAGRLATAARTAAGGRYVLAGHSWGAALAVRVAARRPDGVTGLVLLDGGHFDHADLPDADADQTVEQTAAEMTAMGWRHEAQPLDALLAEYSPLGGRDRALLSHVVRAGLQPAGDGRWESRVSTATAAAAMHALMRSRTSTHYPALAAAVTPVLLLSATEPESRRLDNAARARTMAGRVPQVHWRPLPRCRHDVFLDAPDVVADEIAAWWPG